jgi:uncharacterized protein (DUF2236 family)
MARTHAARRAARDGYFAPGSVIRRVGSSPLIPILGAGPAVLFQTAHPLVAASVAAQPDYRETLWPRWTQIMRALYLIVFGTREEADRVGERIQEVHERVPGATDPALLLWVHAGLVEVALAVYNRYVWPLTRTDQRRFYREMSLVARIAGVPPPVLPPTLAEFRDYVREQLAGEVRVSEQARGIASAVLDAPLPAALLPLRPAHRLATVGLLPPALREQYGFRWDARRAAALLVAASSLRFASIPVVLAAERMVAAPA